MSRAKKAQACAVASFRLILDLSQLIYETGPPFRDAKNFSSALKPMYVLFAVVVATADGRPLTAAGIAETFKIPRGSVPRYLEPLIEAKHVKVVDGAYVADMSQYKGVTRMLDAARRIIGRAARELRPKPKPE